MSRFLLLITSCLFSFSAVAQSFNTARQTDMESTGAIVSIGSSMYYAHQSKGNCCGNLGTIERIDANAQQSTCKSMYVMGVNYLNG